MPPVEFTNLLIICVIALLAPLALGFAPRLRIPAVVLEIVVGIVVGPSVLGWVHIDLPVQVLALFGWRSCCFSPAWKSISPGCAAGC